MESKALAVVEPAEVPASLRMLDLTALATARQRFSEFVGGQLVEGTHYGTIPGTKKPTIYKAGAEEVARLYLCTPTYPDDLIHATEDHDRGLYVYRVACRIVDSKGIMRAEGLGSCSSYESRYRWRDAQRVCPECSASAIIKGKEHYGGGWVCWGKRGGCGAKFADDAPAIMSQSVGRVQNEDMADVQNTVLKMACKRALVAAALNLGCCSEYFTQDLDDGPAASPAADNPPAPAAPASGAAAPATAPRPTVTHRHPDGTSTPVATGQPSRAVMALIGRIVGWENRHAVVNGTIKHLVEIRGFTAIENSPDAQAVEGALDEAARRTGIGTLEDLRVTVQQKIAAKSYSAPPPRREPGDDEMPPLAPVDPAGEPA